MSKRFALKTSQYENRHKARLQWQNAESHLLIASVMLSLAIAGCGPAVSAQHKTKSGAETASQGSQSGLEVVMAGNPQRKTLTLTTTEPAQIEPLEQTPIHSKLAAYASEVLVDYGDKVKKGQVILKLSAPELDARLAQKQEAVEQAKAKLLQSEARAKAADAAIVTAKARAVQTEAGLTRAHSDIEFWRSQYGRFGQLATSGSVNRQLVDETQQKLGGAEATLKEANAAIEAAKAVVSESESEASNAAADIVAAKANVRVAQADVVEAEAIRSYLAIKAPFDGVVTLRRVDPGHFVQPAGAGSPPLLIIARSDIMRVFVTVRETEAAYVDVGDPATVEVQSLRGAEFKGQVTRTSFALDAGNRALEAGSRNLETIIDIDNREGRLRPGLYATATITLQIKEDALALPAPAVVRPGKEVFCYRLIEGKASKTPLQLGIKVGDEFEVIKGVSEDDTVILNKAVTLKDGQAVEVAKPEAKK